MKTILLCKVSGLRDYDGPQGIQRKKNMIQGIYERLLKEGCTPIDESKGFSTLGACIMFAGRISVPQDQEEKARISIKDYFMQNPEYIKELPREAAAEYT